MYQIVFKIVRTNFDVLCCQQKILVLIQIMLFLTVHGAVVHVYKLLNYLNLNTLEGLPLRIKKQVNDCITIKHKCPNNPFVDPKYNNPRDFRGDI